RKQRLLVYFFVPATLKTAIVVIAHAASDEHVAAVRGRMNYPQTVSQQAIQAENTVTGVRPTHIRWRIMAMTTLITALANLGRINLGVLAKYIQDEFAFGTQTMGWIFSGFAFAYHPF